MTLFGGGIYGDGPFGVGEQLLFGIDVEAAVIAYLKAELPAYGLGSLPVRTLRPSPREPKPVEWLRIERAGGPRRNQIERASILVEAYAGTGARAVTVLNAARGVLLNVSTTALFAPEEVTGPLRLPDPLTPEQVRYTATIAVRARAALTA